MCGIAGVYLRDPSLRVDLDQMLDTLLLEIEDRGKHATGFVSIGDEGVLEWQKASCDATKFIKHRRWVPRGTRVMLGHTRWATQGEPAFMENNHPIKRGPFFIIHNGHVSNDTKLFTNAERERYGQVDSEAIAARLSSYGDLKFLGNVIEEIEGDAAVAAVDERDAASLVLARGHSSPLYVLNGKRIVVFASTRLAVEKAYERHIGRLPKEEPRFIDEGKMLFWKGENEYWTKDLMLTERYVYRRTGTGWSWSHGDYDYSSGGRLTPISATSKEQNRAIPLSSYGAWDEDDDLSYGWVPCDNCGEFLPWAQSFDLWDPVKRINESVCEDCYDMKISQNLAVDAEWDEGEAERVEERLASLTLGEADGDYCGTGLFGEFEAANEAILAEDIPSPETRSIVQMIRDRIQARA